MMIHSMWKNALGVLGRVMIRTGTHLLLHSHKRLVLPPLVIISKENRKVGGETKTYSGEVDGKL